MEDAGYFAEWCHAALSAGKVPFVCCLWHILLHKPVCIAKGSGHLLFSLLNGVDGEQAAAPPVLSSHTHLELLAHQNAHSPHSLRGTEQKGGRAGACLRLWDQDALHWWWEKGGSDVSRDTNFCLWGILLVEILGLVWFGLCKLSNWLLQTVVDDWLDVYKQDREEGLLELINFVVECSGCKGKSCSVTWPDTSQQKSASTRIGIHVLLAIVRCIVKYEVMESLIALKLVCWLYCCAVGFVTREMFDVMQNADIISHLTKEFNEVSGDQGLG